MFNSQILDVAIGIIFVYLLLSLICSAANEIIEIALKKRAIDLVACDPSRNRKVMLDLSSRIVEPLSAPNAVTR